MFYHTTYYNRKFRAIIVSPRKVFKGAGACEVTSTRSAVGGVGGAVHTSFSFSPPPVPGTTEPAALVAPSVQFAQVQVFPLLDANVLAAHVHDVEVPPVLLEYVGQAWHALPSKYCVIVQPFSVTCQLQLESR